MPDNGHPGPEDKTMHAKRPLLPPSLRGLGLIEVLVVMTIMSVGLLSLAGFQGALTQGIGQSKARAEAIELARARLETFRNYIILDNFSAITMTDANGDGYHDTQESLNGVNATFLRDYAISDLSTPERKAVRVRVQWTDPKDGLQSVQLNSQIAWNDKTLMASTATGGDAFTGAVPSPNAGVSEVGGENQDWADGQQLVADDSIRVVETGGDFVIINPDGTAILTIFDPSFIVEMRGRIFYDGNLDDLVVLASDSGACAFPVHTFAGERDGADCRYRYSNDGSYAGVGVADPHLANAGDPDAGPLPATTYDADCNGLYDSLGGYQWADYYCFLGAGWRGKIGVLGFDTTNDTLCPGLARTYVHYDLDDNDQVIGHSGIFLGADPSEWNGFGFELAHHFLAARFVGGDNCNTAISSVNAALGWTASQGWTTNWRDIIVVDNESDELDTSVLWYLNGEIKTTGSGEAGLVRLDLTGGASGGCLHPDAITGRGGTTWIYDCYISAFNADNQASIRVTTLQNNAVIDAPATGSMTFSADDWGDGQLHTGPDIRVSCSGRDC